jgi:hypothetical protein
LVVVVERRDLPGDFSPASSQIDDHLGPGGPSLQEVSNGNVDNVQAKMIATIDQRRPSLELLHKEAEEMWLVRVVDALHAPLGDYGATIGLNLEFSKGI